MLLFACISLLLAVSASDVLITTDSEFDFNILANNLIVVIKFTIPGCRLFEDNDKERYDLFTSI